MSEQVPSIATLLQKVKYKTAMGSVFLTNSDVPFIVTQSPREIAQLVAEAEWSDTLIELTLGNQSSWNGKPVFVRAGHVIAISPSKSDESYQK